MTRILAFCGQKGGIGKTTLAFNVAAELAYRGLRVLAVDADPQSSLTRVSGVTVGEETLATVLGQSAAGSGRSAAAIVRAQDNLDVFPSETLLAQTELGLVLRLNRERQLDAALRKVAARYDYIVIDSPPSLGLITVNVLLAAQYVVIPTLLESESIAGVRLFLRTLAETAEVYPDAARPLGIVPTMVDLWKDDEPRHVAARELLASLADTGLLLSVCVPRTAAVPESMLLRQPVRSYAPTNKVVQAVERLTDELLARLG